MSVLPQFLRRSSPLGGYESVCSRCIQTIAHRDRSEDLAEEESAHRCDEQVLKDIEKLKRLD